ncbi:MAG: hypothetical protein ACI9AQ_000618 [Dinoroseobacter sp.]|jgi:hypothetical protein
MNDVIPCKKDPQLTKRIEEFSEILKTQSHQLDPFGLSEEDFYDSGILRGQSKEFVARYRQPWARKRFL